MAFDPSLIADVPGWLTIREASLLYDLARNCAIKGVIVEIGSWKGRSTICLAQGARDGARTPIYAIDPFTGSSEHGAVNTFPEFQKNILRSGLSALIFPVTKTSEQASSTWKEPIELLWIDGAHEFEFVQKDFTLWEPHLVDGGTIAFHDSTDPGVWPVIDMYLFKKNTFKKIRFIHGITYATKGKPFPYANRLMMVARDVKYLLWRARDHWRKMQKIKNRKSND